MEAKARGVDPAAIQKIDELAAKQGVSRNVFLVNLINNFAALEEFKSYQRQYETVIEKCLRVIQQNSIVLGDVKRFMENNDEV